MNITTPSEGQVSGVGIVGDCRRLAREWQISLNVRYGNSRNALATATKRAIIAAYQHGLIGPGVASAFIRFLGVHHA